MIQDVHEAASGLLSGSARFIFSDFALSLCFLLLDVSTKLNTRLSIHAFLQFSILLLSIASYHIYSSQTTWAPSGLSKSYSRHSLSAVGTLDEQ
jgi:hypothetical protein